MAERIHFPAHGANKTDILTEMGSFREHDTDWRGGRAFSLVYFHSEEHEKLLKEAYSMYFSENALNPMAFKSLKRFEHETVRMCADLFHGDHQTVGSLTTGGTESLMLAVKTYRDRARKTRPWIRRPEMIIAESAHPALDKGGEFFDVKVIHAPVGPDFRVDVSAVARLINRNTVMIVGSAPQYPQGVVDPIPELGALALKHGIPLHVDACIGFLLPFLDKIGHPLPAFDFRVPGVTSISSDLHKYGFAAKGASVLLYRSMNFLKHQFFVYENWTGGIYASACMPGTKPGGSIAAAWASLKHIGEDGYKQIAQDTINVVKQYVDGINAIPELMVHGHPDATIISFGSRDPKTLSIYAISDVLQSKGWNADRNQKPEGLHLTLSAMHGKVVNEFLADLKEAVDYVKAHPEAATSGNAAMYGMIAKIPFRGMIKKSVLGIMEKMYGPESIMPDQSVKDEVNNWGDFAEKMGVGALELKRQFDVATRNLKDKISKR